MRRISLVLATVLLTALPPSAPRAGLDPAELPTTQPQFELVVLEAPGCTYCALFRRDVLPAFETSATGKQMTVRFVDVNDIEQSHLDLVSAVDIVPTFVVARANKEIGRIPGYVGPENFFHSIDYLLASAP